MKIEKNFFENKNTLHVAQALLGKLFVRITPYGKISWIIHETEAYTQDDPASHSYLWRKTKRNMAMFFSAWHLYVYKIYGKYYCVNIVTEHAWYGSAVLIRSLIPYQGIHLMKQNRNVNDAYLSHLTNGPWKICQALDITLNENGISLFENENIFLEDIGYKPQIIHQGTRIGISKWKEKLWRFWFVDTPIMPWESENEAN